MVRVGITGHITLSPLAERTRAGDLPPWSWLEHEIKRELSKLPAPLVGISALAAGADQLFARLVLEAGGELEAVIPFTAYRQLLQDTARAQFDALFQQASRTSTRYSQPNVPAGDERDRHYLEAGQMIVDQSEEMFAVWERGRTGLSGATYDIVDYSRQRSRPLTIFDPRTRSVSRSEGHPRANQQR